MGGSMGAVDDVEAVDEVDSKRNGVAYESLTNNPFFMLKVSPEDSLEVLTDRFEDIVDDHLIDEQAALKYYQALSSSLPRLEAEVAWLPGVPFAQAFEAARDSKVADLSDWPPLAAANLGVIRIAMGSEATATELKSLLAQWQAVQPDELTKSISRQREASGFPAVDVEQVKEVVERHTREQAKHLFEALSRGAEERLPALLSEALEGIEESSSSCRFTRELLTAYQRWCDEPMKALGAEIDTSLQQMNTLLDSVLELDIETESEADMEIGSGIESEAFHAPAETLLECLNRWEVLSRPLRLECQRRSVDEAHSMRVVAATLDVGIRAHTYIPERATELVTMARRLTLGVPGIAKRAELILNMLQDIADLNYLEEHAPDFGRWVESLGSDQEQLEATILAHEQHHPEPSIENSLFPGLVELLESATDEALVRGAWVRCNRVLGEMTKVMPLVHAARHLIEIERQYPLEGSFGERLRSNWQEMLWLEVQAGIELSRYLYNQQNLTEWLQKGHERFGHDPDKLRFLDAQKTTIDPPSDNGVVNFVVWGVIAIVFFLLLLSL